MRMRNKGGQAVTVHGLNLVVPAGGVCEIADGYCRPQLAANGARIPSIIESLAPQLVPADTAEEAAWRLPPASSAPPSHLETKADIAGRLEDDGMPAVVAAIVAEGPPEPKQRRGRKVEA
jgi:hypothetical protein